MKRLSSTSLLVRWIRRPTRFVSTCERWVSCHSSLENRKFRSASELREDRNERRRRLVDHRLPLSNFLESATNWRKANSTYATSWLSLIRWRLRSTKIAAKSICSGQSKDCKTLDCFTSEV